MIRVRASAIRYGKCGLNMSRANKIAEGELFPSGRLLTERGEASLRKLIPLTDDSDPAVRLWSAVFANNVAPDVCGRVLEELLAEECVVQVLAQVALYEKELKVTSR